MGGDIYRSPISAHFSTSAYFLTIQTYKHMCLITRVYGNLLVLHDDHVDDVLLHTHTYMYTGTSMSDLCAARLTRPNHIQYYNKLEGHL